MTLKRLIGTAAFLGGTLALGGAAFATMEFLRPVSGAGFVASTDSAVQPVYNGWKVSNPTNQPLKIEASMGRWAGLAVFQIFGFGNGGTTSCEVLLRAEGNPSPLTMTPGSKTVIGNFQLNIVNNFVPEDAYYTVRCTLPPQVNGITASLYGVAPDR